MVTYNKMRVRCPVCGKFQSLHEFVERKISLVSHWDDETNQRHLDEYIEDYLDPDTGELEVPCYDGPKEPSACEWEQGSRESDFIAEHERTYWPGEM